MHKTLKTENNSIAKPKIIPILRSMNNLESPTRLETADADLKKRIKDIIKSHDLRLSNYDIVKSLFLTGRDTIKPNAKPAVASTSINAKSTNINKQISTESKISDKNNTELNKTHTSIIVSPAKVNTGNGVDLDDTQNNILIPPLTDESIAYIDETILENSEDGNLSEASNFSSRFVKPAKKRYSKKIKTPNAI